MKKGKTISAIFSVLFGLIFLAGTTGVTFIIHSCPACKDLSVTSGIFLSTSEPEDHCCGEADLHSVPHRENTFQTTCCHFKIDRLQLSNFSPKYQFSVSPLADFQPVINIPDLHSSGHQIVLPREYHNKHGGRCLITSICQLIS